MRGIRNKDTIKIGPQQTSLVSDPLAVEAPLEVQIWGHESTLFFPFNVTMRTPGSDEELVLGFLFAEGIIGKKEDVLRLQQLSENLIQITLSPRIKLDKTDVDRNFYTSSSCGVCGKKSLGKIQQFSCYFPPKASPIVSIAKLLALPQRLFAAQSLFQLTGGIHAAGLFDTDGELLFAREDVGRHNALDKLIGAALQQALVPWRDVILVLSGRISFELVQKASMLGIPIIVAVGAPSSLAVDLAEDCGITLIGFAKGDRCNIYTGAERLITNGKPLASTPDQVLI